MDDRDDYRRQPVGLELLFRDVKIVWAVLGAVIVILYQSFSGGVWFNKNVADKASVDKQLADLKQYVDLKSQENHEFTMQQTAQMLKQAIDHSDFNREAMKADAQTMGAKIDSLKDDVRDLKQTVIEKRGK